MDSDNPDLSNIQDFVQLSGKSLLDVGDVSIQHRCSLDDGIRDIEKFFHEIIDAGVAPISAGGDHSISYPILKAVGRETPVGLARPESSRR